MFNIVVFLAGAVAGAIGMYLIARNSPDHFLKFKSFADAVDAKAREQIANMKAARKVELKKVIGQITRIWFEITLLVIFGVILFLLPNIERQGLQLLLYKILLFSASQVHAHATRQIMFPYINFVDSDNMSKAMVISLHVAAAYLYAAGG